MSKMNAKKRRATGIAWIMIILVIAIAIPLNLIANKLDMNFDMTPKKLYSLSDTTTDYLDELDEWKIVEKSDVKEYNGTKFSFVTYKRV